MVASSTSGLTTRHNPLTEVSSAEYVGFKDLAVAFAWACVIMAPFFGFGGRAVYVVHRELEDARVAAARLAIAHQTLLLSPPHAGIPTDVAIRGREVFATTCATCHGPAGLGIEGMGKDLTHSNFIASLDDQQFHQFIVEGRPTARPMPMPPKGGRMELTDADLSDVVAYVRGLQDTRRMPVLPERIVNNTPSQQDKDAALAAAGGDAELAGYIANGNKLFHSTCVACHGKGGIGVQGNGKALVKNDFVKSLDDDGLLAFVKQGRSPSDPKTTTGIQMPPKGGNPALSDDDLLDIIAYIRTLQGEKSASTH